MTRDTKLGLLVTLLILLVCGVLLSSLWQSGAARQNSAAQTARQFVPTPGAQAPPAGSAVAYVAAPAEPVTQLTTESTHGVPRASFPGSAPPARVPGPAPQAVPLQPNDRSMVLARVDGLPVAGCPVEIPAASPAIAPATALVNPVVGPMDVPALPANWTEYQVQPGDTLGYISQKVYNTSRKYRLIYLANRDKLPDENRIRAGMSLRIPPLADSPTAARPAPAAAPTPPAAPATPAAPAVPMRLRGNPMLVPVGPGAAPSGAAAMGARTEDRRERHVLTYQVQPGDSLSTIAAEQLGSARRWQELWDMNRDRVPEPDRMGAGVVLRLPDNRVASRDD